MLQIYEIILTHPNNKEEKNAVNLKNGLLLQGLPTLFPWPSKKCYEALLQEIHGYVSITSHGIDITT